MRWRVGVVGLLAAHGDATFRIFVAAVYLAATVLALNFYRPIVDRMMILATQVTQGRLDSPAFAGIADSVEIGGRYYVAVGPLQVVPYVPFVPFEPLHGLAGYVIGAIVGIAAAWLSLPMARAYGATGTTAYWVACLSAFGTLLFYVSVFGDIYYLAQAEAFLALVVLLIEWAGRRRPLVLGILFALAFLARPTTVVAAIPFGVVLLWQRRRWWTAAAAFGAPIVVAGLGFAAYNWARFGSPIESGYALSLLVQRPLIARRELGTFSVRHIAENLRLAFVQGFRVRDAFPFLVPNPYGLSMLLVSPGLLLALWAGFARSLPRLLWVAVVLVAIPIFLYYGGGFVQYGFRYSLDFTPFLLALVALGTRRRFGWPEKALIVFSAASVTFGVLWHAHVV